jgi:hypothetical protein
MPEITDADRKMAQNIVGEWGYEEEYWWRPIAKSIAEAREKGRQEMKEEVLNIDFDEFIGIDGDADSDSLSYFMVHKFEEAIRKL